MANLEELAWSVKNIAPGSWCTMEVKRETKFETEE